MHSPVSQYHYRLAGIPPSGIPIPPGVHFPSPGHMPPGHLPGAPFPPSPMRTMFTPHSTPVRHVHTPNMYTQPHHRTPPNQRKETTGLQSELQNASKEQLIQMICDLSFFSSEVSAYIDCKAQLFGLYSIEDTVNETDSHECETTTPEKKLYKIGTMTTPQTPADGKVSTTPTSRQFCTAKHPCLWIFGSCRYPKSCLFRECPQNLCLGFVRGHCPSGTECNLVHRLPENASEELKHLHEVNLSRQTRN